MEMVICLLLSTLYKLGSCGKREFPLRKFLHQTGLQPSVWEGPAFCGWCPSHRRQVALGCLGSKVTESLGASRQPSSMASASDQASGFLSWDAGPTSLGDRLESEVETNLFFPSCFWSWCLAQWQRVRQDSGPYILHLQSQATCSPFFDITRVTLKGTSPRRGPKRRSLEGGWVQGLSSQVESIHKRYEPGVHGRKWESLLPWWVSGSDFHQSPKCPMAFQIQSQREPRCWCEPFLNLK